VDWGSWGGQELGGKGPDRTWGKLKLQRRGRRSWVGGTGGKGWEGGKGNHLTYEYISKRGGFGRQGIRNRSQVNETYITKSTICFAGREKEHASLGNRKCTVKNRPGGGRGEGNGRIHDRDKKKE